jgi:dTMP kinase
MAHLRTLNYMATGEILPDVTLILDLPVSTALERLQHRGGADDVFERETVEFWEKLRQGFLDLARQHPVRSRVIDADGSEEEVAARIKAAISRKT